VIGQKTKANDGELVQAAADHVHPHSLKKLAGHI